VPVKAAAIHPVTLVDAALTVAALVDDAATVNPTMTDLLLG